MKLKTTFSLLALCAVTAANAQVSLNSGLKAYYPFNNSFNDASGNGNHGVPKNGITFTADQWGNSKEAALFDGVNDWIQVPASASIAVDSYFTFSFRMKVNADSSMKNLFAKITWNDAENIQYSVGFNHHSNLSKDGIFLATENDNNCHSTQFYRSAYNITGDTVKKDRWMCVVIIFDKGISKIYQDGILKSTDTVTGVTNLYHVDNCTLGDLNIGTWWKNDPMYYNGVLDEMRFYNRALNTQEIDSVCKLKTVKDDPSSIVANSFEDNIRIYPNPSNSIFNIDIPYTLPQAANIFVTNITGQTVYKKTLPATQTQGSFVLNLGSEPLGIYMLQIQSGELRYNRKLILTK
jgi:hypothetical protein